MFSIHSKGISLVQNYTYMFKQDQLSALKNYYKTDEDNFHIYMVGKRPLMMFNSSTYDIENGIFKGTVRIAYNGSFTDVGIIIPMEETIIKVSFEKNDQYIIIEDLNSQIFKGHASLVLQGYCAKNGLDSFVLDLEVLYIGRSFGHKTSRNVFDRLDRHETVQKIYSEASWDCDIWMTAWKFTPNSITVFDPNDNSDALKNYINHLVESKKNNTQFLQLADKQNIAVAEAALINYFKPQYNVNFKDNFPSPSHEYKECYELNLDYVMVELDTSELGFRLWSPSVEVSKEHRICYTFDSKLEFKNLFNF